MDSISTDSDVHVDLDKFTIHCERCNHTFEQEVQGIAHVDWNCPKCKQSDETAMIEYVPGDPNFYNRKVEMGRGGALSALW